MMGIDLAEHADLIRDLVMTGFGSRLRQFQIDPEDALQQVYLGLLVRNEGKCPFDPAVGALSTYLYWVVNGVTCNLIAREWHRRRQGVNPVLASQGFRHDVLEELPRREILMEDPPDSPDVSSVVVRSEEPKAAPRKPGKPPVTVRGVATYLRSFMSSRRAWRPWEIAQETGIGVARVHRALCWLAERGEVRKVNSNRWEQGVSRS